MGKRGAADGGGDDELRDRPDAPLRDQANETTPASVADAQRLLHQLDMHRVELEIQNEELLRTCDEARAALERSKELFDFAPIGYLTLSGDRTIRAVNHVGAQLLARDRVMIPGRAFSLFVAASDYETVEEALERSRESGTKQSCEVELIPYGRVRVRARVTVAALAHRGGEFLVAFEDVSEQKRRETQLALAEQQLRDADRRKDEFLAALSHELRNPLAPIRTSLYVALHAPPGSDEVRRALKVIDRQVAHIGRLIEDLLDVTRITRGKMRLTEELLDLADLVRVAVDDARAGFDASGIRLEADLDCGAVPLRGDRARLIQVVSNMLGNAEKFTERGGLVRVILRRREPWIELVVRDTGAGIPRELLEHLFEPFAQAPQTIERSRGGLGLGLAMIKGIVELHGGTVRADSAGPGHGTEVLVQLPLVAHLIEELPRHEERPAPAPRVPRRVLVVEDNEDAAESLRDVLTMFGHTVEITGDGRTALAHARVFRPDVVLCDLGLPGMDGFAVARAFRADEMLLGTYLVALSGFARAQDAQRSLEAGFDHHLAKPVDLDALAQLIDDAPIGSSASRPAHLH